MTFHLKKSNINVNIKNTINIIKPQILCFETESKQIASEKNKKINGN